MDIGAAPTGALTEECHPRGVTAERPSVLVYPPKGHALFRQAEVKIPPVQTPKMLTL